VAQIFDAADQRVLERDDLVLLEVEVDADPPANEDRRIPLLAPVVVGAGQAFARRVTWRGTPPADQPSSYERTRRPAAS
jgi:hypothetical protein